MDLTSAYLQIVEQPANCGVRFRYECEGQYSEIITGENSSVFRATYPSVRIHNYSGNRAMIVVSCVTSNGFFRQHPNHLVGSVDCQNGIYIKMLDKNENVFELKRCGIQCAKRSQVRDRLVLRREMGCDPTIGGFDSWKTWPKDICLTSVRLCFQAYIEEEVTGLLTVPLKPVVSSVIYDKKVLPSLEIKNISQTCCPMSGAKVMLFSNRCKDNNIEVLLYHSDIKNDMTEKVNGSLELGRSNAYKGQISFNAPDITSLIISHPFDVYIILRRPSDGSQSEPILFTYLPDCPYIDCELNVNITYTSNNIMREDITLFHK